MQYSVISDGEAELKTQAIEARTVKMRIVPVLIVEESALDGGHGAHLTNKQLRHLTGELTSQSSGETRLSRKLSL